MWSIDILVSIPRLLGQHLLLGERGLNFDSFGRRFKACRCFLPWMANPDGPMLLRQCLKGVGYIESRWMSEASSWEEKVGGGGHQGGPKFISWHI